MSIINVPSELPMGITGNPYVAWDISKFFDLNWPDHAGMIGQGLTMPGLGRLGQAGCATAVCDQFADDGSCIEWDDSSCSNIVIPVIGNTPVPPLVPDTTCASTALSSMSAQDMLNCGYTTTLGGPLVNAPVNTPVTPSQAGLTAAQQAQLIAATGNSAVSLIRTAAGGPYTVAGTNLIYNPATGQLTTAAATNATATLTAGLGAISQYIPYIALAIAAIVVLPMLTGKK